MVKNSNKLRRGKRVNEKIIKRLFEPKNRKGTATKIFLLKATISALAEDGMDKLTFDSVGKRVGCTATQVRYHFAEKSLLISTAIEYVVISYQEAVVAHLAKAKSDLNIISSIIKGIYSWAKAHQDQRAVYLMFLSLAGSNPNYRDVHTAMFQSGIERMKGILCERAKKRKWSDAHLEMTSVAVWALIDGMFLYFLTTDTKMGQKHFSEGTLTTVKRLLEA